MKYSIKKLESLGKEIFIKIGVRDEYASIIIHAMIEAESRGISSHGMSRIKKYCERLQDGRVDKDAEVSIKSTGASSVVVNGNNAPGTVVAWNTLQKCIEKAKESGACFASVSNSTHYGAGSTYILEAARHGMIGFSVCNADPSVVPFGGSKPMLGTNPLSVSVPTGSTPVVSMDMATSVVAKGKVNLYDKLGKKIPEGWIIDKDGNPTTDPKDVVEGALLPFGGPKGYCISYIIDLLASGLSGASNCRSITSFYNSKPEDKGFQNVGYFMGVIDVNHFVDIDIFKSRADSTYKEFKECPPMKGFKEVMSPGEIEDKKGIESINEGIEISDVIINEIKETAKNAGIPKSVYNDIEM